MKKLRILKLHQAAKLSYTVLKNTLITLWKYWLVPLEVMVSDAFQFIAKLNKTVFNFIYSLIYIAGKLQ